MNKTTRRDFLKLTGTSAAGLTTLSLAERLAAAPSDSQGAIPPHQPLAVPGLHIYPTEHSIAIGQTLELHLSSSVPSRLAIYRLGHNPDGMEGDTLVHDFGAQAPNPLPVHPGSYVHVERALKGTAQALTLECWVRPFSVKGYAGLITQYSYKAACGFGLFLQPGGGAGFYLGDGGAYRKEWAHESAKETIKAGQWHHVVATWDGATKRLWVNGKTVGEWPWAETLKAGSEPLRLAAYGNDGRASSFLDGDLAMCAMYDFCLLPAQVERRFQERGLVSANGKGVLACWNFAGEKGDRVADVSGSRRHGRVINHATWQIGGPSFNADVPRFGNYAPARDPQRGHGLRFAADDLYDCRWPVTHRWRVPADAKPGYFVARAHFDFEGRPRVYHCTFLVRKPPRARKAPILLVAATNTWRAYSGTQFAITPPELKQVWGTGGIANGPTNPPAFNLYRAHAAGQGTYQVGLRMPWPAAGPYILYGKETEYSHLMRADRFLHIWLEQQGYDFDLVSDLDLHREPGMLRGYRAFIVNAHNEYWSLPMYHGLEKYLQGGGNVVVLAGNALFWRVSFNEDCSIMECRKADAPGMQVPAARRGEAWHSHDGLRGGMLRECGWPGWKLIGLDSLGWNNQHKPDNFGPYVVERADHFLFNEPEKLKLKPGDKIGWTGTEGKMPMANGHEFDVRPSTLKALQEEPDLPGSSVPPDPPNIVRIANGIIPWGKGGSAYDWWFRRVKPRTDQGGEMIWWERPDGGTVFNAGSIGFGWALLADAKLQGLLRNVLARFGVERRS